MRCQSKGHEGEPRRWPGLSAAHVRGHTGVPDAVCCRAAQPSGIHVPAKAHLLKRAGCCGRLVAVERVRGAAAAAAAAAAALAVPIDSYCHLGCGRRGFALAHALRQAALPGRRAVHARACPARAVTQRARKLPKVPSVHAPHPRPGRCAGARRREELLKHYALGVAAVACGPGSEALRCAGRALPPAACHQLTQSAQRPAGRRAAAV